VNGALGVTYANWHLGPNVSIEPVAQIVASYRGRDGGAIGDPANTGYTRFLVAPGVAVSVNTWKLYADVEVPFYQHVNGNQLIAPAAFKMIASYSF
jgi:hypothetical protein